MTYVSRYSPIAIKELPELAIDRIFFFLDPQARKRASSVCSLWNQIRLERAKHEIISALRYARNFQVEAVQKKGRRETAAARQMSLHQIGKIIDESGLVKTTTLPELAVCVSKTVSSFLEFSQAEMHQKSKSFEKIAEHLFAKRCDEHLQSLCRHIPPDISEKAREKAYVWLLQAELFACAKALAAKSVPKSGELLYNLCMKYVEQKKLGPAMRLLDEMGNDTWKAQASKVLIDEYIQAHDLCRALELFRAMPDSFYKKLICGDLGFQLALEKKYDEAHEVLKEVPVLSGFFSGSIRHTDMALMHHDSKWMMRQIDKQIRKACDKHFIHMNDASSKNQAGYHYGMYSVKEKDYFTANWLLKFMSDDCYKDLVRKALAISIAGETKELKTSRELINEIENRLCKAQTIVLILMNRLDAKQKDESLSEILAILVDRFGRRVLKSLHSFDFLSAFYKRTINSIHESFDELC